MGQQLPDLISYSTPSEPHAHAPATAVAPAPLAASVPHAPLTRTTTFTKVDLLRSQQDQTATRDRVRRGQISPERPIDLT